MVPWSSPRPRTANAYPIQPSHRSQLMPAFKASQIHLPITTPENTSEPYCRELAPWEWHSTDGPLTGDRRSGLQRYASRLAADLPWSFPSISVGEAPEASRVHPAFDNYQSCLHHPW
jgi:hypothetical protein